MFDPHHYPVILYWSADDQAFIVEVPDLPGCMADGPTQEAALTNVVVVIQEWMDFAQELGRAIPAPRERLQIAA